MTRKMCIRDREVRLHARVKERPDPGYTNPPCIHRKKCKMTCLCDEQCGRTSLDIVEESLPMILPISDVYKRQDVI